MQRALPVVFVTLSMSLVGCGGSCPRTADASESAHESARSDETSESESAAKASPDIDTKEPEEAEAAEPKKEEGSSKAEVKKEDSTPEPSFPDHASVSQAIAAIPRGATRANIETDTLSEPLQNASLYEPCNIGAQHFKLKVAIWNGHAVGVDVTTPNKKLAECIDKQVRGVEWRDKVRSLNTVEYSM